MSNWVTTALINLLDTNYTMCEVRTLRTECDKGDNKKNKTKSHHVGQFDQVYTAIVAHFKLSRLFIHLFRISEEKSCDPISL